VVEFDADFRAISLEEKPAQPRSKYAVPGLYFYDNQVSELAENLPPSARGEIEITDLNRIYMEKGQLEVEVLGRGFAWLDAGTHESLLQAATFIQAIEERQGIMISCPEEIAYARASSTASNSPNWPRCPRGNRYGDYLEALLKENH
jgi:glucose-1-phosphate thymidylyltransferase